MTIEFRTPTQFLQHFQRNDELALKAKQSLRVLDISSIRDSEADKKYPEYPYQVVMYYLNTMILPLGKVLKHIFSEGCKMYSTEIEQRKGISIYFTQQSKFSAGSDTVACRLSDLFNMMMQSGVLSVQFLKDQRLKLIDKTISEKESVEDNCLRIISENRPNGYQAVLYSNDGVVKLESQQTEKMTALSCDNGFKIVLIADISFASIRSFVQQMFRKQKIEILPYQMLRINDSNMGTLSKKVISLSEVSSFSEIVFDQLFPGNQTVSLSTDATISLDSDELCLYSSTGCTLALTPKRKIITDLSEKSFFYVPCGQELWIYNVNNKEFDWMDRKTFDEEVMNRFYHFIDSLSEKGCRWEIKYTDRLNLKVKYGSERKIPIYFSISSDQPFSLTKLGSDEKGL